jgi:hypothetical protein
LNKSPPTLPLPSLSSTNSIRKSTLCKEPEAKRIAKERLQGMKRDPERERLKWVSAESTETEEREGMKKTEEREEGKNVIRHDSAEYNHNDLPSFPSSSTLSIVITLFPPHIIFLRNEGYVSADGLFPSN